MAVRDYLLGYPDGSSRQWGNFFFVCDTEKNDLENIFSPEYSDIEFDEMFEKMRVSQNASTDFNGLFKVRNSRSIPLRYGSSWYLCVNNRNDFFLFPSWSRLTSRTGWIYSISRNYSDGSSVATEKLYNTLTGKVNDKISLLPKDNWYSIDIMIQEVRAYLESENLIPNRSQILSTSDWQNRYLICDKPVINLKKLEIPEGDLGNPFPMGWLVGKFMSDTAEIPKPEHIALREKNLAPTIVDILNMDDRELRKQMFDGNGHISRKCLREMGFGQEYDRILSGPDVKTKLLELSLGYKRPRKFYYQHFSKISENMDSKQMDFDLELRVGEVFEIWIESLRDIAGFANNHDFIKMINQNVSKNYKYDLRTPVDLGSVNLFVDYHQKSMNDNDEYRTKVMDRLPERMNRLLSPKGQQMLEILSFLRNKNSHVRTREKSFRKYHEEVFNKWVPRLDEFNERSKRRLIEDFYKEFYGVNKDVNVSSVPTLMEVIEFRHTNRGKQALLKCMRNGTEHILSLSGGQKIISYTDSGKKKRVGKKKEQSLQIDDRLFVWATTNPTLVDPLIIRF